MSTPGGISRREFLQLSLAGMSAASLARPRTNTAPYGTPLAKRLLGNTGTAVSIFSMGGQATLEDPAKHPESLEILHRAIDLGVNFIDTAASYGGGASEKVIGEVMATRRKEVFLATKTEDRSYDGAMRQLEASLKRLRTDSIDLWQFHNIQTDNDVDFILSREGAVKAFEKARDEGIVRFSGVTGHKDPDVLKRAIELYSFDTILMALNAADRHDRSFIVHLLPTTVEKQMGIMAMKVPSRGKIFHDGGVGTMEQAMRYVLTLPVSTAVIGISTLAELEEDVRIASEFKPYNDAEMKTLEESTRHYFADALWYRDHM